LWKGFEMQKRSGWLGAIIVGFTLIAAVTQSHAQVDSTRWNSRVAWSFFQGLTYKTTSFPGPRSDEAWLLVHGCRMDGETFAEKSGAIDYVRRFGGVLIVPTQSVTRNVRRCWNWFMSLNQARDVGEMALLRQAVDAAKVEHRYNKLWVAGISSGGIAANHFASAYPDRVDAVLIHSGAPFAVATNVEDAERVIVEGPDRSPIEIALQAYRAGSAHAGRTYPKAFVIHGQNDQRVVVENGEATALQWASQRALARGGNPRGHRIVLRKDPRSSSDRPISSWRSRDGGVLFWKVSGLLHRWSGGDQGWRYGDAKSPRVFGIARDFFLR
jgi:poly(hydroxyalkanoate) depolymerase family esterase